MATVKECAVLSKAVYCDENETIDPVRVGYKWLDTSTDNATGFRAEAYQNVHSGEIVIAYRGTENEGGVKADLQLAARKPEQLKYAKAFCDSICDRYPHSQVTLTGHSLGGALVQMVDAERIAEGKGQLSGITFAAPGVSHLYPGCDRSSVAVENYCRASDPVPKALSYQLGSVATFSESAPNYVLENGLLVAQRCDGWVEREKAQHKMLGYLADLCPEFVARREVAMNGEEFDFRQALVAHQQGNEQLYAQLDALRGRQDKTQEATVRLDGRMA